jgi:PAS domain S-box-containing protein
MSSGTSKLRAALSATGRAVLDTILDATPSIAVIADIDGGVILRASRFGYELSGWQPHEVEGLTIAEYTARIEPNDLEGRPLEAHELPIVRAMMGERVIGFEASFLHRNGERIPVVVNAAPFLSPDGEVIGAINSATDMRRFKALEAELRSATTARGVLYEELAHRVKNHLQIMSSFISLEARDARAAMERMVERLSVRAKGLAAIYDRMNQADWGGRISALMFMQEVVGPYKTDLIAVEVTAPQKLTLSHEQAAPFGMLLNEAVCNSYKHAFPDGHGRITVTLRPNGVEFLELEVADDGVGFSGDISGRPSHGLKLMQLQGAQLGAALTFSNRDDGGARVLVVMPLNSPATSGEAGNIGGEQPYWPPESA